MWECGDVRICECGNEWLNELSGIKFNVFVDTAVVIVGFADSKLLCSLAFIACQLSSRGELLLGWYIVFRNSHPLTLYLKSILIYYRLTSSLGSLFLVRENAAGKFLIIEFFLFLRTLIPSHSHTLILSPSPTLY
jgi:hypothetical protein